MRTSLTITPYLFLLILLASCRSYRHAYSPGPHNNHSFRAKNESNLAVYYSGADGNNGIASTKKNEGIDILAGYAITDHLAVTGGFSARREKDGVVSLVGVEPFDSSELSYRRRTMDIGIGYFTTNARKKASFSIYGGFAKGNFSINDSGIDSASAPYSRFYKSNISKFYLQPGFRFWLGDDVSLAFAWRYFLLNFNPQQTNYSADEQEYFYLDKLKKSNLLTSELSFGLEYTLSSAPWLKFSASTTVVMGWLKQFPSTRGICGSIGVGFDLF